MSLSNQIGELVRACFSGIWIESHEHREAVTELAAMCRSENWQLVSWDIEQGLRGPGGTMEVDASDPLAAVRALSSIATPGETTLLVLENFHRFLGSPEIVQAIAKAVLDGKSDRLFVVVLSPIVQLPVEIEKLFVVVEHQRPTRDQLKTIAGEIATDEGEMPEGKSLERLLDAAAGLTRYEAEGAFSLSLVRHGDLRPETIWQLKAGMLKKSGLLDLHRSGDGEFQRLGGLESLKAFCCRSLLRAKIPDKGARARGVMLLGVPGVGKSAFCKALGRETGRPTLTLDVGALMGSLVGQTEANVRQALSIADAMAPCILFVDEIEKALSGSSGSGSQDSGVAARLLGTLLTWMNDHTSDVYLVATCNDISKLPPEFTRAERFDGVFFLDLPSIKQRATIWEIYVNQFGLVADQSRPDDKRWTGAEIRACCRLSQLLDVPLIDAASNIVPIANTASETVATLRGWANGRCLSAERAGVYRFASPNPKRRRVTGKPSTN